MAQLTFVLGGARSGKSSFAQRLAAAIGGQVTYVATAEPGDLEMTDRIARHRAGRPASWRTLELVRDVDARLPSAAQQGATLLIDCLSVWLSNELLAATGWSDDGATQLNTADATAIESRITAAVERLTLWSTERDGHTIIVSNEVGYGVVPAYPLGRLYRDVLGRANQLVAERAGSVFLVVAGIGVDLRRLEQQFGTAGAPGGHPAH